MPLVSIQIHDRNGVTETISNPDRLEVFESVDFLSSQPYKKVLRVYRNKGKAAGVITTYHPNGTPHQYLETQEMRASGAYREWHPNGVLKIDAMVIGGTADTSPGSQKDWLFEGIATIYDEQGHLIGSIPYEKGLLEGVSVYYYPTGSVQKELPYHKGELEGTALEYDPLGQLKSKREYKEGVRDGLSLEFWSSDQLAAREIYSKGYLHEGEYYRKEGELFSQVKYSQGFQAVFEDGFLKQLVEIRKGKPEGLVQIFSEDGTLYSAHSVKQGKKEGDETVYYAPSDVASANPQPKLILPWVDDAISGIVKSWYPNGTLQSQREMSRNQKSGPSLAWYQDGGLMYMEEYEQDRLVKGTYFKKNQRDPVSTVIQGTGIATLFDENGVLIRKVHYQKGRPIDPED
jgi:antitoxin component YwqK of YwqJK toxin-antitoxin module